MFETRLINNRSYAVLSYLSTTAGEPITLPGESGAYGPRDDGELAMAGAHAADTALGLAVDTAAEGQRRGLRHFYKALRPENGAAAVVIMAHGLAAISARMASGGGPISVDRQLDARRVMTEAFAWTAGRRDPPRRTDRDQAHRPLAPASLAVRPKRAAARPRRADRSLARHAADALGVGDKAERRPRGSHPRPRAAHSVRPAPSPRARHRAVSQRVVSAARAHRPSARTCFA